MALKFARHPARFAWRSLNLLLVGRIRRLAMRGGAALRDWAGLESNPFLQRALRIEGRKYKPLLTILGAVVLAGILIWGAWRVWPRLLELAYGHAAVWRGRASRSASPFSFLVTAVGGSFVSCVAMLTATACAYISITATRARSAYLLRQELFKGTLDQLQLLPIREERWLWMMSAHPTALTLLLWLIGLPVYCLALLTEQWSLHDIFGLLLVFLMLGHILPLWQPVQWKQKNPKGQHQKFDLKTWRETLKRARGELDPSQLPLGQMTAAQHLEMQRRTQRAISRVDELAPATATAETGAGVAAEAQREKQRRRASKTTVGGGSGRGGSALNWFIGWITLQAFIQGFVGALSGFRGGVGPFGAFWSNLPPDATVLLPAFPLSWPLLLARILTEPMPFFALALPPGVLIVPLWIGFLQQRFAALAANVSSLETFWIPRRVRKRKAIGAAILLGLTLLCFGYGWELLVVNGLLALFLRPAPLTTSYALAAGWTLCLVIGTTLSSRLVDGTFKRFYNDEINFPQACQTALRLVLRCLACAIGLYLVFCWMGRLSGMDDVWLARLGPTLATALSFMLAVYGSAALQAALPASARGAVQAGRFIWFWGLALVLVGLTCYDARFNQVFSFEQAPIVLVSPWVSLLSLFRVELSRPTALWWWGPLAQAILGAFCLLGAAAQHLRVTAPVVATPTPEAAHWSDKLFAPFLGMIALLRRALAAVVGWVERINEIFHSWDEWMIERGRRYDNAVLTAELRRRVPREYWLLQVPVLCILEAMLFVFIADPSALWGVPLIGNWLTPIDRVVWGQSVVIGVLTVSLAVAILSSLRLGQSFDRERSNGTLLFLFLTPMTDAAILGGKVVPTLCYGALLLSTALPWLLGGCLVGMVGGSAAPLLLSGLGLVFILAVWICSVCFQLVGAIYASKPGEGAGLAILAGIGLEGVLSIATTWTWVHWGNATDGASDGIIQTSCLIIIALTHLALAYGAWRLALWLVRRQRYGDVLEKSPRFLAWLVSRFTRTTEMPGG